jgi:hypothetical protein
MRIWKFPLDVNDLQTIPMPHNAQILHVASQSNQPCLWALVDENASTVDARRFVTYGIGNPMPDDNYGHYVGTYQMHDGQLVCHVFEV